MFTVVTVPEASNSSVVFAFVSVLTFVTPNYSRVCIAAFTCNPLITLEPCRGNGGGWDSKLQVKSLFCGL